MIRDVVVHMNNEQPLMADLRALPTARDACLVCTNLRYIGGKKPTFIDHVDSWFLIPLHIVRFVEVPASAVTASERESGMLALGAGPRLEDEDDAALDDIELEEQLLRRIREV